jgi:hypothetical protein
MASSVIIALAIAVVALFWQMVRHSNDLFILEVERGKPRLVKGRIPPSLLSDLGDVTRRSHANGTLRAVVENQRPRLIVSDSFGAADAQALKNVLGTYTLARIRAGTRRV